MKRRLTLLLVPLFLLALAGCGEVPTILQPGQSPPPTLEVTATILPTVPLPPQGYPPLIPSPAPPVASPVPTPPDSGRIHITGEVQLTDEGWEGSPVWSPDGSKVAFTKAIRVSTTPKEVWKGELWVMNADGTSRMRIAENVHAPPVPSWSPDGQRLVYIVNKDGSNEVVVADLGRGEQEVVATGDDQGAAWVTGGHVAFVRDGRLMLKDLDAGTEEVRGELAFTGERWETGFVASPDGTRLAYVDGHGGLWIVELATMATLRASPDTEWVDLYLHYSVSWSPDSRFLAYVIGGPPAKLWVADAMTGASNLLLEEHAHFNCPTWSPDSRVLAFATTPTGSRTAPYTEIYLVNRDGSGLRRLTENEQEEGCPLWSPDGSNFIFTRPPSSDAQGFEKYLWLLSIQYN